MDRHTGESPEDRSEHCFDGFRSDLSSFIHQIHNKMRNPNGQSSCQNCNSADKKVDTPPVSKIEMLLLPSQAKFIESIMSHVLEELIESLKFVHNSTLYLSDVPIEEDERLYLHNVKILWECFAKIKAEI